jgi:hypothetical protein
MRMPKEINLHNSEYCSGCPFLRIMRKTEFALKFCYLDYFSYKDHRKGAAPERPQQCIDDNGE